MLNRAALFIGILGLAAAPVAPERNSPPPSARLSPEPCEHRHFQGPLSKILEGSRWSATQQGCVDGHGSCAGAN